jgi:hypothetical protein
LLLTGAHGAPLEPLFYDLQAFFDLGGIGLAQ